MKKEIIAAVILVVVFAASLVNIYCLEKLTAEISSLVEEAGAFAEKGDWVSARSLAEQARDSWKNSGVYTDVVLRHSEIEDAAAVIGDLLDAVYDESAGIAAACAKTASDRLKSIASIEKIRPGSIF